MPVKKPNDGAKFEDDVFRHVKRLVRRDSLCVPANAEVHRIRSYYSEARKARIEFEIAIEAFDDGAEEPSLIWVWECKDHTRSERLVEVSAVEILRDKITQLGSGRFKASLVTTHGFQSAAEQAAISGGINLIVLQKEFVRITKYAEGVPAEKREELFATFAVTFNGRRIVDRHLLQDIIKIGLRENGIPVPHRDY
ncbi:MAG TPA: hypothetical protein VMV69_12400 [Pirellulales bacterium]|nr:hypothetical protein [Pirellulales bacterium]